MTHVKVLMALADDELVFGKNCALDGEWIDITIRNVNILLSMVEDVDWLTYIKYINIDLKFVEEKSQNYKAQPYQYASPSKQILKAEAKPFTSCTHCGFNDHRLDDCRIYPECEIWKNGTAIWPPCNWNEDEYCNTGDLPRFIREGNSIRYKDYEWYETVKDGELKEDALINKRILEESINAIEESSDNEWDHDSPVNEWKDYEHTNYNKIDVSSNQNTNNNVCQIVMDHCKTQEEQGWFGEHELMGDDNDDISDSKRPSLLC
ncbi:hypothetical protein Tco_0328081 [Tanacetum coccineum]